MADARRGPFAEFHDRLVELGYSPIPIIPGTKRPAIGQWSTACHEPFDEETREKFACSREPFGLGIALGFNDVVGLDLDVEDQDIVNALGSKLPTTPMKKRGAKGATGFFRLPNPVSRRFRDRNGRMLIEVLGPGCQTVLPPTQHPSGRSYEWIGQSSLLEVRADELPYLPGDIFTRIESALRSWLPVSPAPNAAAAPMRQRGRYLDAVVRRRANELARTAEGGRNAELNAAAYRLARLGLSLVEVSAVLSPVAAEIGLEHREIVSTIKSAWTAGSGREESHG